MVSRRSGGTCETDQTDGSRGRLISDFFWGGFTRRWRSELGLPDDANPYYHYDLDWICTVPNMDPWIRPFETLEETSQQVVVKTGYPTATITCLATGNIAVKIFPPTWQKWPLIPRSKNGGTAANRAMYLLPIAKKGSGGRA